MNLNLRTPGITHFAPASTLMITVDIIRFRLPIWSYKEQNVYPVAVWMLKIPQKCIYKMIKYIKVEVIPFVQLQKAILQM